MPTHVKKLNIVKITESEIIKKITNLKSIFIPSIVVHFVIPGLVRQRKAELCEFRAALSALGFLSYQRIQCEALSQNSESKE